MSMDQKRIKSITVNKKAYHDYFVEDRWEAGIELFGTEVKSIRQGSVNLRDSYCIIKNGEILVVGMHIAPYEKGNIFNKDPLRQKRLLMHKSEINKLNGHIMRDGAAIIPLSLYFKGSTVKMEIGLCKGKKLYDKRADLAAKAASRDLEREFKDRNR